MDGSLGLRIFTVNMKGGICEYHFVHCILNKKINFSFLFPRSILVSTTAISLTGLCECEGTVKYHKTIFLMVDRHIHKVCWMYLHLKKLPIYSIEQAISKKIPLKLWDFRWLKSILYEPPSGLDRYHVITRYHTNIISGIK